MATGSKVTVDHVTLTYNGQQEDGFVVVDTASLGLTYDEQERDVHSDHSEHVSQAHDHEHRVLKQGQIQHVPQYVGRHFWQTFCSISEHVVYINTWYLINSYTLIKREFVLNIYVCVCVCMCAVWCNKL